MDPTFKKTEDGSTPGGIPAAEFLANVDEHLKVTSTNHEQALAKQQDLYSKYKFIEMRLATSKGNLKSKLPEIKKTLDVLKFLKDKADDDKEYVTNFELAPNILAKAKLQQVQTVNLWLGANVMMEFSFQEAEELLSGNLETAGANLTKVDEQLAFLRDQITTTEVNMARIYNHEVRIRRLKGEQKA